MPEKDALDFIIAIGFVIVMILIIVVAYAMHLLSSSRRLRQAQRFSSAVVEFTPALMIIVFDHENRVVAFNKGSEMLSGYFAEEILGKKSQELPFLPNIFHEDKEKNDRNASTDQQAFTRTTAVLKLKDGSECFIEWQIRDFRDENGRIELKIASGLDITELKQTQEKLRALTANLSVAEDRERKRIAEELHDRIGEILIVSNRKIADLKSKLPSPELGKSLDELSQTIRAFLKGTRSLIFELIPPILYDIGLEAAIESLANHFTKQYQIDIIIENDEDEKPVDHDISMFLYKAVRELLLNVVKHADAEQVRIMLSRMSDSYQVVVEDSGVGFEFDAASPNRKNFGFGLFNIKTQAEYYHGNMAIETAPGKGSRFTIRIPLGKNVQNGNL